MNKHIQTAKKEIIKLEKVLEKVESFLSEAPEGCLKWQNRGEKTYYYQQYLDENDMQAEGAKWGRRYLKNDEIDLAKKLATKHYYAHVRTTAQKQLEALKGFVNKCPDVEITEMYEDLSDERKCLVAPLYVSVEEKIRRWESEVYEQASMYPENLKFETDQGDLVRSKSEVIIANLLYRNREDILYKYERPLKYLVNGNEKVIYPDFSIINKHTGKIIYWEHAGRMDDPNYAADFVKKMNIYMDNGLLPGRDVILTFETQNSPLDIRTVKKIVKTLL